MENNAPQIQTHKNLLEMVQHKAACFFTLFLEIPASLKTLLEK